MFTTFDFFFSILTSVLLRCTHNINCAEEEEGGFLKDKGSLETFLIKIMTKSNSKNFQFYLFLLSTTTLECIYQVPKTLLLLSTINIQISGPLVLVLSLFSCSIVFLSTSTYRRINAAQLNSGRIYMRPQIDDKPFARSFVPSQSPSFLYPFEGTSAEPLSIISSLTKSEDDLKNDDRQISRRTCFLPLPFSTASQGEE